MAKINRRDYLIRMGAGAGAIVGASKFDLFAQEKRPAAAEPCAKPQMAVGTAQTETESDAPLVWENRWKDDFPPSNPDELVKLIFYGLAGFCPHQTGDNIYCDVGFHRKGDDNHHHRLEIHAFDRAFSSAKCNSVYDSLSANEKVAKIELRINKPSKALAKGAYFYQPTDSVRSRKDLDNPKDFRWIIDFESDYLYRNFASSNLTSLPKIKGVYRPRFQITNALFYTLRKTASTFRAQSRDGAYVSDLGNVADFIGANVYVEPKSSVTLTINSTSYEIQAPGEIYFL